MTGQDSLTYIPPASIKSASANPSVAGQVNDPNNPLYAKAAPAPAPAVKSSAHPSASLPSAMAPAPVSAPSIKGNGLPVGGGGDGGNAQGATIGSAPAGVETKQSANGLWYDSGGNAYTQGPAAGSGGAGNLPGKTGGIVGPDSGFGNSSAALAPTGPLSESDFFGEIYKQLAPVISAINGAESSAETAAYAAGTQQQNDLSQSLGGRGLAGSGDAIKESANTNLATAGAVAKAKSDQAAALSTAYQFMTSEAWTQFTNARDNNQALAKDYETTMQTTALSTVKGLAEAGITSGSDLQSKNPQAYLSLLQYYKGDPSALDAALTLNQPIGNIAQSWVSGTTYNQIITDPITGKPKVQTLDLGIAPPTGWITQKVGTTSVVLQDPNNPANTIIYATNPFTGAVTITGTGTEAGLNQTKNPSDTTTAPANTGAGTASTTISSALGVDPVTPLSDVIASNGMGTLVAAMIKNEGGSLAGVTNNPGNIKFTGAPGQTDSGVKAADGGTFASYTSPADGQKAIASLITDAASGTNPNYGASPTLQSFVDKYTNTGSSATPASGMGTNGLPLGEYGLLANVSGFNPKVPGIDSDAMAYLNTYLTQGKIPVATDVGLSSRSGSIAAFTTVKNRADDVYFQATGQHLPDQDILDSNKKLIAGNLGLLNSLSVQEQTIKANSDLMQSNISASNINQNAPAINSVVDYFKNYWTGNPDVASYLAQNSTLSNELGSLLALKNASGTTVHDKLISADLISPQASAAQEAAVVNTLMKEAMNARRAIGNSNAELYKQIDPVGLQPGNPITQPGYSEMNEAGATNNYDGTWTLNGQTIHVDANGNATIVSS